jgi:hypothetical protein
MSHNRMRAFKHILQAMPVRSAAQFRRGTIHHERYRNA